MYLFILIYFNLNFELIMANQYMATNLLQNKPLSSKNYYMIILFLNFSSLAGDNRYIINN